MYTTAHMTPADRALVCAHLSLAPETLESVDPDWLYHRLADVDDVRLKIAQATMRGVTVLPRDKRLDPDPWPLPPALRALQASQATEEPAPTPWPRREDDPTLPADCAVVRRVGECPAAPGSRRATRFRILEVGATIGALRERGLRVSDLRRYLSAGVLELGHALPHAPLPGEENA